MVLLMQFLSFTRLTGLFMEMRIQYLPKIMIRAPLKSIGSAYASYRYCYRPCIVKDTLMHPHTHEEKWPLYMGGIGAADIFPRQANMSVSLAHTAIRISHLFSSRPITALNSGRVSLTNTGL